MGMFCDNTPTVEWETRLEQNRSITSGWLPRALALRQRLSKNDVADLASRATRYDEHQNLTSARPSLARHFSLHSPLSHKQNWCECFLNNNISTSVISELLGRRSKMALWTIIKPRDTNTGDTGVHTSRPSASTPTPKIRHPRNSSWPQPASLKKSGEDTT